MIVIKVEVFGKEEKQIVYRNMRICNYERHLKSESFIDTFLSNSEFIDLYLVWKIRLNLDLAYLHFLFIYLRN